MMLKKKVRILDSIAGLADPRPKETLDAKYAMIRAEMKKRASPPSDMTIEETIKTHKLRDRYGEPELGFPRDWSFKPDQEVYLNTDLAAKWEAAGICLIVEEKTTKAA